MPRLTAWQNYLRETRLPSQEAKLRWKALTDAERAAFATKRRAAASSASRSKSRARRRARASVPFIAPELLLARVEAPQRAPVQAEEEEEDNGVTENASTTVWNGASPSGSVVMHNSRVVNSKQKQNAGGGMPSGLSGIFFDYAKARDAPALSLRSRPYQVPAQDFAAFEAWRHSHPVHPLTLPAFDPARWLAVRIDAHPMAVAQGAPEFETIYLPRQLRVHQHDFVLLSAFPGTYDRAYFVGGSGAVAAYQQVDDGRTVVVKASLVADDDDGDAPISLEQEAFEILEYLKSTDGMRSGACGERFIHMTAGCIAELQPQRRQAFVMLERMDMTLTQLAQQQPRLFRDAGAIRILFRALAEALACMHTAKPRPIAHGDLKPDNVLCSPYTDHWLAELIKREQQQVDEIKDDGDVGAQQEPEQKQKKFMYVKLADFDTAFTSVWDLRREPRTQGTETHMSPDRMRSLRFAQLLPATTEDDVWAFGITLLQLCGGREVEKPIEFMLEQLHTSILTPELRAQIQKRFDEQIASQRTKWTRTWLPTATRVGDVHACCDLLAACLQIDPAQRPTITQLMEHAFVVI